MPHNIHRFFTDHNSHEVMQMKRLWFALMVLMCANNLALAQSSPGLAFGEVPTAAQWNSYFSQKQDYLGYVPLSTLGGTMLGKLNLVASGSTAAGLNCGAGSAPSSPVNGDVWCTSSGMFAQINGSTVGPFGTGVVGTLAVTSGGTGQTTFTANAPIIGNGTSALAQGTRSGSTTAFVTTTGTLTSGHCVSIDGSGNMVDAGGACTTGGGGGTVSSSTIGQIAVYTGSTTVTGIAACNNGYYGTNGSGIVSCTTSVNTTLSGTITALGTVTSGIWGGTVISPTYGGTGSNNGSSQITIAGNVSFSGAFAFAATLTASTSPTFPSGTYTLATQTGTSGGIPYYSSSTTQGTSSALASGFPVLGGGAGTPPTTSGVSLSGNTKEFVTTTGSQTSGDCVSIDANGNHIDAGVGCGGGSTLLATYTGGGTSYSDTTHITSSYNSYTIVINELIPSSATNTNNNCLIQIQVSATPETTGYISNSVNTAAGIGVVATPTFGVTCSVGLAVSGATYPNSTGIGVSGSFLLTQSNFGSSGKAMVTGLVSYQSASASLQTVTFSGFYNTAAIINGILIGFTNNSGAFTSSGIASGTVKIYGNS
jgi:hypothetical protein